MAAILTLLATITMSLLVTRVGAIALRMTGLSHDVARFQARSAFSGVGFTTNESEMIINHPVRRRILMLLMLWGNFGIVAVIASTIASFTIQIPETKTTTELFLEWFKRLSLFGLGISVLWAISTSRYIDSLISAMVEKALSRFTTLDVQDYTSLLHLQSGYVVIELPVKPDDWIDGKNLAESNLSSEGVLILGLTRRSGEYVGSPNGDTRIQHGDVLTVYGPVDRLGELDIRKRGYQGDRAHKIAIEVQKQVAEEVARQ